MRKQIILFFVVLALVIFAGIGTASLMWGSSRHVPEKAGVKEAHPVIEQVDSVWHPLEGSSDEGENAV